jgi:hypothetical protein
MLAAVWCASGWWMFHWGWGSAGNQTEIEVGNGLLFAMTRDVQATPIDEPWPGTIGLWRMSIMPNRIGKPYRAPQWLFGFSRLAYPSYHSIVIPLWAPAAASLLAAVVLFRFDRRGPPNSCPRCRYDLSATPPSAPCRGASAAESQRRARREDHPMTRPRRWRWWGKWATLTIAVAIAVGWFESAWYLARLPWPGERWPDGREAVTFSGKFGVSLTAIPLWLLFLPFAASSAWLWRLDRKPKPGHCPRCGYDLSGIPSGACPECGSAEASTPG